MRAIKPVALQEDGTPVDLPGRRGKLELRELASGLRTRSLRVLTSGADSPAFVSIRAQTDKHSLTKLASGLQGTQPAGAPERTHAPVQAAHCSGCLLTALNACHVLFGAAGLSRVRVLRMVGGRLQAETCRMWSSIWLYVSYCISHSTPNLAAATLTGTLDQVCLITFLDVLLQNDAAQLRNIFVQIGVHSDRTKFGCSINFRPQHRNNSAALAGRFRPGAHSSLSSTSPPREKTLRGTGCSLRREGKSAVVSRSPVRGLDISP
jgi:hypothetical protein